MVLCCPICQDKFEGRPASYWSNLGGPDKDPKVCRINCGHTFHPYCIGKWWDTQVENARITQPQILVVRVDCPVCRYKMLDPLRFEIQLVEADDKKFLTQAELQEKVILTQNIVDTEKEIKDMKAKLETLDEEIASKKNTKDQLRKEIAEIRKEGMEVRTRVVSHLIRNAVNSDAYRNAPYRGGISTRNAFRQGEK